MLETLPNAKSNHANLGTFIIRHRTGSAEAFVAQIREGRLARRSERSYSLRVSCTCGQRPLRKWRSAGVLAAVMTIVGLYITRVVTLAGIPSDSAVCHPRKEFASRVIAMIAATFHVLVAPAGSMIAAEIQSCGRIQGIMATANLQVHGRLPLVTAKSKVGGGSLLLGSGCAHLATATTKRQCQP